MVVVTRNRRRLLLEAVAAILSQRDVDLELVVVDNGSDDGTPEAVASLGDPRVRIVRQGENKNLNASRNDGIAVSRGTWIALTDDDDLWAPDKLRAQLDAAAQSGRSWVYCGVVYIDEQRDVIAGRRPDPPELVTSHLLRANAIPGGGSNAMVRKDVIEGVGLLDPAFRYLSDWDLWIRVAQAAGEPAWVPRPLVAYRVHASSVTLDVALHLREAALIEQKYATLHGGRTVDRGKFASGLAWAYLRQGRRAKAFRSGLRALAMGDLRGGAAAGLSFLPASVARRVRRRYADHAWLAEARSWLS